MCSRFFRDHALRELGDALGSRVGVSDVRWVVTVPAIWRQQAKQFMREAAYQVSENKRKFFLSVTSQKHSNKIRLSAFVLLVFSFEATSTLLRLASAAPAVPTKS